MKCRILKSGLLLSMVMLAITSQAQIWLSNEDIFDEAEEYLNSNEYIEALPLYLLLEKKDVINAHIAYKIGTCYLNIRGKKSLAVPYLETACESVSDSFKNTFSETNAPLKAYLLLGVAYRIENRIPEAIDVFSKLRKMIEDRDPEYDQVIDMHLNRCENAKLLNAFPNEPRTERLPDKINTVFSNYNPVLVGHDSILYYMDELKFYDAIMRAEYENGEWSDPRNLTPAVGSDGDHILVGASADGNTLFLYYYEPLRAGELYVTNFSEQKGWSKIMALNGNINTVYHETHASLSADGKTLYFTSNREGGYGGLDIYKSRFDSVTHDWGPASNLGPKINTPYNEETPIINADNEILYFSSQGHLNMGGYDIFYAQRKGENDWRQPINMGAPVCTTDDDLFYYPLEEHVSGLMSRLDNPASAYDIYRYNSMVFANTPRFTVKGKTEDVDTANYKDYTIAVVNNETADTLQHLSMPPDGNYEVVLPAGSFGLVILSDKQDETETQDVVLNDESSEITLLANAEDTTINKKKEKELITESGGKLVAQKKDTLAAARDTVLLRYILYAFDDYSLTSENKQYLGEIQTEMIKHPTLSFQVEGHTDAMGPSSYNLILSEKRAKAVVNYLQTLGIMPERLKIIAKGEKAPAAINNKPDGTDSPQGRKYNRRVVLKPLHEIEGIIFLKVDAVPDKLKINDPGK